MTKCNLDKAHSMKYVYRKLYSGPHVEPMDDAYEENHLYHNIVCSNDVS